MPRFRHRHHAHSRARINMTPMIDVTFLLLTFFMLASHFASAEKIELDLPKPDHNQAVDRRLRDKVIVNVIHQGPGTEPLLQCGPMAVDSLTKLREQLENLAQWNPNIEVILRSDRRVGYGHVRRVMQTIASTKLTKLQVVTELGDRDTAHQ